MDGLILELDSTPITIITPTIPEMLILFLGFAVIIAVMYILYLVAKKGIRKNEERLSNAEILAVDLLVITTIVVFLLLVVYEHMGFYDILSMMWIPLILSVIFLIPIHIKPLRKEVKIIFEAILVSLTSIEYFVLSLFMYVDMVFHGGTYTSYSIYALTTIMLLVLLYVIFTIILHMKTKRSLTVIKVIIILSAILAVSNVCFYFGYEISHPVRETGNWKMGTYEKIYD